MDRSLRCFRKLNGKVHRKAFLHTQYANNSVPIHGKSLMLRAYRTEVRVNLTHPSTRGLTHARTQHSPPTSPFWA